MKESGKAPSFDEGLTAQMRGDLDAAIAIFEQVLLAQPENVAAYHQVGRCYMKQGLFEKAVGRLEAAVRFGPDRIAARLDLGMLHLAMGNPGKAKVQLLRALSISDSNVKAMTGLGIVYFQEQDHGKAIAQFQDACTLNPSSFACHYYLARIHEILNNSAGVKEEALKAIAICHGLIRMRPEQPEAYFLLAETFMLQKEYKPALQNYLIAKDFSPDGSMHFFAFGMYYTLVDNYLGIARCYEMLGEQRYARYFGELTLKIDPENVEAKRFAAMRA